MARSYSAKLIALTLRVPLKWVDNLLSHHALPGVFRSRQGVERRVTDDGLLAIEATRMLTADLGLPLGRAAAVARSAVESRVDSQMQYVTPSGVTVVFPLTVLESRLRERVVEAVETIGRIPRGRPPREISGAP